MEDISSFAAPHLQYQVDHLCLDLSYAHEVVVQLFVYL